MRTGQTAVVLGLAAAFVMGLTPHQPVAAADLSLPIAGPFNKPPTCTNRPQTVPLTTNLRYAYCADTSKSGYEARRDIEAKDNGGNWNYSANSTVYLDCTAHCALIEPITRRRACGTSTC